MVKMPGFITSYHIGIYLPTAGKEEDFISSLAALNIIIEDILEKTDGECPIFIRGDGNSSSKNTSRSVLLNHLITQHSLQKLPIKHNTYHHFIGNGQFDSDLDIVLFSNLPGCSETLSEVICKNTNPLIDSHHDIVVSSFSLPPAPPPLPPTDNIVAPRIHNNRQKVTWSTEGIVDYSAAVSGELTRLLDTWGAASSSSPACMSLLLSSTYNVMNKAAAATNKVTQLGVKKPPKVKKPFIITKLQRIVLKAHKYRASLASSPVCAPASLTAASEALAQCRGELRRAIRAQQRMASYRRDCKLTKGFSSLFKSIRSSKASAAGKISSIRVGSHKYSGESVPDGFFDSMSRLKRPNLSKIHNTSHFQSTLFDFENIMKICKSGRQIPPISPAVSEEILKSIRGEVNDFYSITANHFINAGAPGLQLHHFILSTIIMNVNLSVVDELNTAWACIIYKGHKKDKESDRSYRNICVCPLMAKSADLYIGRLYSAGWAEKQAETQFQGEGSSHELAALLFTETIQHSLYINKKPVFALLLDAMSAYDKIVKQCALREAFLAGTDDEALLYLNARLSFRRTFPEWDQVLMGPIHDLLGLEQGGTLSDKLYKLCNNNQLTTAQNFLSTQIYKGPLLLYSCTLVPLFSCTPVLF